MAFRVLQHNFEKRPTVDQRKVLDLFGTSAAGLTRIEAHLKIRLMLQADPQLKRRLEVWRRVRREDRARRRNAQPG